MTDNTMREQFARLKAHERHANAAESRYWCAQYKLFAEQVLEQAVQMECLHSDSVPVVGEPVAWTSAEWLKEDGKLHEMARTEAVKQELDALRKDAERYRWLRDSPDSPIINIGYATDKMVDAAIAQGKGE